MKIYRCVLGCLLVFFIAIGVWYMVSCFGEQRSTKDGILIQRESGYKVASIVVEMREEGCDGTDNGLYKS